MMLLFHISSLDVSSVGTRISQLWFPVGSWAFRRGSCRQVSTCRGSVEEQCECIPSMGTSRHLCLLLTLLQYAVWN